MKKRISEEWNQGSRRNRDKIMPLIEEKESSIKRHFPVLFGEGNVTMLTTLDYCQLSFASSFSRWDPEVLCLCSPVYVWGQERSRGRQLLFLVCKILNQKEHVNQTELAEHHPGLLLLVLSRSLQLCPILFDPIDGSSPIPGIPHARTLEWVAISFSSAWKWKVKVKSLSRVRLLATPCTAAYQAPSSMGFSRQEYWSRVPLPSPTPRFRALDKVLGSEWGGVYSTTGRKNEM